MTLFSITGIIIVIANVFLSILIFSKAKLRIHYIWIIFCLQVALWGLGVYKIGLEQNYDSALLWWKIAYIGVINIPALYAHFIFEFLQLEKKIYIVSLYFLTFFFQILNIFSNQFIRELRFVHDSFYYISNPGIFYNLFVVIFFSVVLISAYKMIQAIGQGNESKKTQLRAFLYSSSVGYFGGAFAFLPVYDIDVYPVLNVLVGIFPLAMTYAILKHRMMDIRLVIQKGILYSILLGLIISFYLVLIFTLEIIAVIDNDINRLLSGIITIIVGIYGIPEIEKYFRKKTDKIFYKDKFDFSDAVYTLSKILNRNIEIETLLRESNQALESILKTNGVATVLLEDNLIERIPRELAPRCHCRKSLRNLWCLK